MPDYSKGKIYKIVDNTNNNVYIGSTCEPTLAHRLAQHRSDYAKYLRGVRGLTTSFLILANNNYDIVLLEECDVNSRDQLFQRERYYQDLIPNINKLKNARTPEENREVKILSRKNYELKCGTNKCQCGGKYLNATSRYNKHLKTEKHTQWFMDQVD
jgi:predicted GIY-YIG superfamily endonuclease